MDTARIAELLHPYLCHSEPARRGGEESAVGLGGGSGSLTPAQLNDISTYVDLLLRWNARINLTAIRDPEQIITRHFGESLFDARILFPFGANDQRPRTNDDSPRVADLGSGAGFPGIPLKLWSPQISLTLIESNHKKAAFLREVARALTLTDINIQNARAESLSAESFDVVTLRAVERFETILPIAASLVAPGGRLALLIGDAQFAQAKSALPSFEWSDPIAIPNSTSRILALTDRT